MHLAGRASNLAQPLEHRRIEPDPFQPERGARRTVCHAAKQSANAVSAARAAGRPGALTIMAVAFLDFEQPIAELEAKIEELKHVTS